MSDAIQVARAIRQYKVNLLRGIKNAESATIRQASREATRLNSGTLSYSDLRRLDHPYATRHGGSRVPGDPAIINRHTGNYERAWKLYFGNWIGSGLVNRLVNDSKVADFLDKGTRLMIARPTVERVYERIAYDRARRINDVIERTKI